MSTNHVTDRVEDAITGQDQPMEKTHPRTSAAVVFLSYPIAIIAVILLTFVFINMFGRN